SSTSRTGCRDIQCTNATMTWRDDLLRAADAADAEIAAANVRERQAKAERRAARELYARETAAAQLEIARLREALTTPGTPPVMASVFEGFGRAATGGLGKADYRGQKLNDRENGRAWW